MKKVSVFFKNRNNPKPVEYITQSIEYVFGGYATPVPYFLDELQEGQIIDADAHLVLYEEMLPSLSNYLADFSKVIIMKYNMPKANLEPLKDIPAGQLGRHCRIKKIHRDS